MTAYLARGQIDIDPPLQPQHVEYLRRYLAWPHISLDVQKISAAGYEDPVREAVGLPLGKYGQFFVGPPPAISVYELEDLRLGSREDVPPGVPSKWCPWRLSMAGEEWSEVPDDQVYGINSLDYDTDARYEDQPFVAWLDYLIGTFFRPWGYVLDGEFVMTEEADSTSVTVIVVTNNRVCTDHVDFNAIANRLRYANEQPEFGDSYVILAGSFGNGFTLFGDKDGNAFNDQQSASICLDKHTDVDFLDIVRLRRSPE